MSEEQEYIEHEIVDRLYCLEEKDFDKTKVEDSYIQAVLKAGKENKNLIDKLQKQNREYEYTITGMVQTREDYFIPKYKIRDKIKELESKKEQYNEQPLIYHILKNQLEELLGE